MPQEEDITSGLNNPVSGSGAPATGGSRLIITVVFFIMVFDLLSFGSFWMGPAITSGSWSRLDHNIRSVIWPEFLEEAEYYAEKNMPLVNLFINKYLSIDRDALGNGGPFLDYLFQKFFRVAGFFTLLLGGAVVTLFAAAEAYKRNKEKRLNFEKLSATAYHFTLRTGSVFSTCFFFLYVFMPGKFVIPGVAEAQVPFLLYNPYFWASVMTVIAVTTIYITVSNMTNA